MEWLNFKQNIFYYFLLLQKYAFRNLLSSANKFVSWSLRKNDEEIDTKFPVVFRNVLFLQFRLFGFLNEIKQSTKFVQEHPNLMLPNLSCAS